MLKDKLQKEVYMYLVGFSIILYAFGLSGTDFGLPSFITFNRVANIIVILLLGYTYIKGQISIPPTIQFLIISISVISILGLISMHFSAFQDDVRFSPIVTLFFAIPLALLMNEIFKELSKEDFNKFFKLLSYLSIGAILIASIYVISLKLTPATASNWMLRRAINEQISVGMSRLMNGLFILNSIVTLTAIFIKHTKKEWFFVAFSYVQVMAIVLITGTRQTLLGMLAVLVLAFLCKVYVRKQINKKRIFLVSLALMTLAALVFLVDNPFGEWLNRRFIEDTIVQLQNRDDYFRWRILSSGIEMSKNQFLIGVGPGTYNTWSYRNSFAHNGYVDLISTFGWLAFLVLVTYIISIFYQGFKLIWNGKLTFDTPIYISFILTVTFLTISNNFNDLLFEYITWMILALLIAAVNLERR